MAESTTEVTRTGDTELVVAREFAAPRELVFRCFTSSEHLEQWWGPRLWPLAVSKMDFRVGGQWLYCMRGPDGTEAWGKAIYTEITPPERIVYTDYFADATGTPQPGMPVMVLTMEFIDLGERTRLSSHARFATAADLDQTLAMGMVEGLTETWDRLAEYLEVMR